MPKYPARIASIIKILTHISLHTCILPFSAAVLGVIDQTGLFYLRRDFDQRIDIRRLHSMVIDFRGIFAGPPHFLDPLAEELVLEMTAFLIFVNLKTAVETCQQPDI